MEPEFNKEKNYNANLVSEDIFYHAHPLAHTSQPMEPVTELYTENVEDSREPITRNDVYVLGCIAITELCETLTYFSVLANMVLFCTTQLQMQTSTATVVTLVFSGSVNIIPVFGGFVADALLGKFNTILLACLINILGLCSLTASAVDYVKSFGSKSDMSLDARKGVFFTAIVLVAIGTGSIKANLGPFGAHQIQHLGTGAVQSFFHWFYWFRNVGAIIAYTAVAYVQQEQRFDYGYMIPLVCMVLTLMVFMAARSRYKDSGPEGSALGKVIGFCITRLSGYRNINRKQTQTYEDTVILDIKSLIRLLPIFGPFIVYWAVYSQMDTTLFLQSVRMDISIGKTQLPAAILNSFNSIFIIILIPVMDGLVYPLLERRDRSLTHTQRIGLGMILAVTAMLYAGILEIVRKNDISNHGYIQQTLADDKFNASKISMFAQIPEFTLLGASEVLTVVSGLECAYTQAPMSIQGLIMGIFCLLTGLGTYLATVIVAIVKSWKTSDASNWYPADNPNHGHLEYTLFLLAVLAFGNLLLFILVARWYRRKQLQLHEPTEKEKDEES